MDNLVKVQCILETGYNDKDLGEFIDKNRIYYVSKERAELIEEKKAVKILKEQIDTLDNIEEEALEMEVKKTEKSKRRNRRA